MASILKVDKLDPQSGTALEIGTSGDTITVPSGATFAVSGTMNASSITAGTLATARMAAGSVVQVVGSNVSGGNVDIASTTYTDTGATVTITPQLATSKIIVFARGAYTIGASTGYVTGGMKLMRNVDGGSFTALVSPMADTTGPYEITLELAEGPNISGFTGYYNYVFYDDPDTTTACIYKLQASVYSTDNSQQIRFGNSGGGGGAQSQQMVVMEVNSDS